MLSEEELPSLVFAIRLAVSVGRGVACVALVDKNCSSEPGVGPAATSVLRFAPPCGRNKSGTSSRSRPVRPARPATRSRAGCPQAKSCVPHCSLKAWAGICSPPSISRAPDVTGPGPPDPRGLPGPAGPGQVQAGPRAWRLARLLPRGPVLAAPAASRLWGGCPSALAHLELSPGS